MLAWSRFPPCRFERRGSIAKYAAAEKKITGYDGPKWPTFSLPPISILESKISVPIRHPPFCGAEQNFGG